MHGEGRTWSRRALTPSASSGDVTTDEAGGRSSDSPHVGGGGGGGGAVAAGSDGVGVDVGAVVARQLSEPVLEQTKKYKLKEEPGSKHRARGTVSFRLKLFAIGASAVTNLTMSTTKRSLSRQFSS